MIDATTYRARRAQLRTACGDGLILLPGNEFVPRNYADNVFPFRQSSHVLYYAGISRPGIALVVGPGEDQDVLFGPPEDIDDVIWHGPHETLAEGARRVGIPHVRDIATLGPFLADAKRGGSTVQYLPPYQHRIALWMSELLGETPDAVLRGASAPLAKAVADQRLRKSDAEIAEIEDALEITAAMHRESMRVTRPGIHESDVAAAVQAIALAKDRAQSYNPIITVHGEVLHNNTYKNRLESGQILLNDSGAESPLGYASDITRSYPVDGTFRELRREIYEVCLASQLGAISVMRPGVPYQDVHLHACRLIAEGLTELGLMKGDPQEAVAAGAHALFFPHGLGHALGLDVHDMEDLGDVVGYPENTPRSDQFGLNFLRFAKPLEPGFVMTVEPGIYFIPALIDRWQAEGTNASFIDFERVSALKSFGGIRIEDDVLVTDEGTRVLGPPIPKTVEEVEAACAA